MLTFAKYEIISAPLKSWAPVLLPIKQLLLFHPYDSKLPSGSLANSLSLPHHRMQMLMI